MRRVFDRAMAGREAAHTLADLPQENRPISDYSIEFRTLAAECKWNAEAQWDMFLHGLADRIQKEIFTVELPTDLDGLIELALRVNAHLQQCDQRGRHKLVSEFPEYSTANSCKMVSHPSDCEPMQVGRAQLSREKRDHRRTNYLCYFSLYCGAAGHFLADCPVKGQTRQ